MNFRTTLSAIGCGCWAKNSRGRKRKKTFPPGWRKPPAKDADGDGTPNEIEILLGHNPGDLKDAPTTKELNETTSRQADWAKFLASYRWQPFEVDEKKASTDSIQRARENLVLVLMNHNDFVTVR